MRPFLTMHSVRQSTLVFVALGVTSATAEAQLRFEGTARNGAYRGTLALEVTSVDSAQRRLRTQAHFGGGLSGDGELAGTLRGAAVSLTGSVVAGGTSYAMSLDGTIARSADGRLHLTGSYLIGGGSQRGSIDLVAPRLVASGSGSSEEGRAGASIEAHQAQSITPHQAQTLEAHHAATIDAHTAQEITAHQAGSIDAHQAQSVEAHQAQEARRLTADDFKPWKRRTPGAESVDLRPLLGTWQLAVPGAAYTTEDALGNVTSHTSAGARAGRLALRPDGTYAYGGVTGRWERTENADYPIVLHAFEHGQDFGVGLDTPRPGVPPQILVTNGDYSLKGGRAR